MKTNKYPYIEDWTRIRKGAGIWVEETLGLARIAGKDGASWLQPQTCNDVMALTPGTGKANALLDRKGRIQACFTLHRMGDDYLLIIERDRIGPLFAQFEAVLFLEEVAFSDESEGFDFVVIQGPRSAITLAALSEANSAEQPDLFPVDPWDCAPVLLREFNVLAFHLTFTGEDGYLLLVERGRGEALADALVAAGAPFGAGKIGPEAHETARIEAGIPKWGIDMDETTRISETPLEQTAVSYSKGCYLGQEVVAKLKNYAGPRRAHVGLKFAEGTCTRPTAGPVEIEGKAAGAITSCTWSPALDRFVALAYLERAFRTPGTHIEIQRSGAKGPIPARVVLLPFVPPADRKARAQALYQEALDRFEQDADDRDTVAVDRLREAILLDPAFEDAYESLGVMLHRQGRTEEAIGVMQTLARLNPDCIMAHTNLSVFYVSKGMIREAEEEKAKAAAIEVKQRRQTQNAAEVAAAERHRIQQEARERIGMFREVLELDPDDPLATYGMGMAFIQLNKPAMAIPYLERTTQIQKDYSAAYLSLGQCFEATGQLAKARSTYETGIAAAGRKGDLMPLREMETRLRTLDSIPTTNPSQNS